MAKIRFLEPASHRGAQLPLLPVRVLGIDLGTTNSTVSEVVWDPSSGEPPVARAIDVQQDGVGAAVRGPLVPSAVAVVNGKPVVGYGAGQFRLAPAEFALEEKVNLFYETKNEIGLDAVYPDAPDGFRTPAEIGGHVLRALHAEATARAAADGVVVTVPASFATNQRAETVRAAALAGIDVAPGELLDEPVAAFVDWFVSNDGEPFVGDGPGTLLVFDFGGGTCDVAVLRVDASAGARPEVSPLAVSRYHRLGGGDVDRAIVYEALVPQLVEQNGLGPFELDWDAKRNAIEPALLAAAEALKIRLCADPTRSEAVERRTVRVTVDGRELRLVDPTLTRARFAELLAPFVDRTLPFGSESEYRTVRSIFHPIEDALDRAGLGFDEVDYVLLAGGSSLIPEVVRAVEAAFPEGDVLAYPTAEAVQTAVSRGAAYHAMSLALFGEGVVRPVAHESISLRTSAGPLEIVPRGAELPYPIAARSARVELAAPEDCDDGELEIKIEVIAGDDLRPREARLWRLPAPVEKGEPLVAEVCLDENRVLHLTMRTERPGAKPLSVRVENPITHVVNPGETRLRIAQAERRLRRGDVPPARLVDTLTDLGKDCAEIGQRDKALHHFKQALKRLGRPSGYILHRMGMAAEGIGDEAGARKYYAEAAKADPAWSASLFNLALLHLNRNELEEARAVMRDAITRTELAPYFALEAKIAALQGDAAGRDAALARAFVEFRPVASLDAWELHWFEAAARLRGDEALVSRAVDARRALASAKPIPALERGLLPDRAGTLA